jgi:amidase
LRFRCTSDAARIADREPVRGTGAGYGLDEINAYMLLSQAGRVRLGNMVDPKVTMGASIIRKYLAS